MISKLFPPEVVTVVGSTEGAVPPLHPEEAAAVARASAGRLREYAAGRAFARRALARFGVHDFPLRSDAERLPLAEDSQKPPRLVARNQRTLRTSQRPEPHVQLALLG